MCSLGVDTVGAEFVYKTQNNLEYSWDSFECCLVSIGFVVIIDLSFLFVECFMIYYLAIGWEKCLVDSSIAWQGDSPPKAARRWPAI